MAFSEQSEPTQHTVDDMNGGFDFLDQSANRHPRPGVSSSSLSRTVMPPVSRPIIPVISRTVIPVIIITLFIALSTQTPVESGAEQPPPQPESDIVLPEKIKTIHYFYSPGCSECLHAEGILDELDRALPHVKVELYNMFEPGVMEMREGFDETYDVPSARRGAVPAVFVGQSWFIGVRELEIANDEGWLAEALEEAPKELLSGDKDGIAQRFASFSLGIVLGAGLIDGINPCAFAGLAFLMSYLLMSGTDRKHLLYTGLGFCVAMFMTYLAIGTGILSVIKRIQAISWIIPVLGGVVGLLAVVLGVLSIVDAIRAAMFRDKADFTLKLPTGISKAVRATIRKRVNPGALLIGAMATGFLVAAMEFLCTGQVYLPTIVYVHSVYPGDTRAMLYLVAYNLAFMTPAVGVFLAAYFGMGSKTLARLAARSIATVKLLTGLLFLLLGGYLVRMLWQLV